MIAHKIPHPVFGVAGCCLAILAAISSFHHFAHAEMNETDESGALAALDSDLNGDGIPDRAEIVPPFGDEYDNTLRLFLAREGGELELVTEARGFVWGNVGMIVGQEPTLDVNAQGSLLVGSQNQAIGRNRWQQQVTIAYRDGKFRVAGYSYFAYDTLDPEPGPTECDLNLFTGKGVLNGKNLRFKKARTPVEDWQGKTEYALCGLES